MPVFVDLYSHRLSLENQRVFETVAVVGATGAVGAIIRELLESRKFPHRRIKFLASGRSAGSKIVFAGKEITVEELTPAAFEGVDLAIGSTPDEVLAETLFPGPSSAAARSSMRAAFGGWIRMSRWSCPR